MKMGCHDMPKTVYRVAANFTGRFKTATAAKTAFQKLRENPKAQVSPVKKSGSGYTVGVKYIFVTPSVKIRDQAIKGAKAKGAKVTVSARKV